MLCFTGRAAPWYFMVHTQCLYFATLRFLQLQTDVVAYVRVNRQQRVALYGALRDMAVYQHTNHTPPLFLSLFMYATYSILILNLLKFFSHIHAMMPL